MGNPPILLHEPSSERERTTGAAGRPFTARGLVGTTVLATLLAGCSKNEPVALICLTSEPIGPGFPSGLAMVVTSEATPLTLSLLSVDQNAGLLGIVGGPMDITAPIGDAETAAVDRIARRIYVGSDIDGTVAVVSVAPTGALTPISGSPFPLEAPEPTVVVLNTANDVAYVGYRDQSFISRYPIDPATGALGTALPRVPINGTYIETMRRLGDLLFVICNTTSNLIVLRVEPDGSLTDLGVNVLIAVRPDYVDFIVDSQAATIRVYISTTAGTIDAFDVNTTTGKLSPLPGAPYGFPGLTRFELLRASPDGRFIAVGAEKPAAIGLMSVESDGSLAPVHKRQIDSGLGGPEGLVWTPNGRFLFVANHVLGGILTYELVGDGLVPGPIPCHTLPGRPIDLVLVPMGVNPR